MRGERELADLVEEHRSTVRGFEEARSRLDGAGERALLAPPGAPRLLEALAPLPLDRSDPLVDHERFPTREAAMRSIGDYIDNFYNVERRHSHLDYLNPIEFELRSQLQQRVA